jgi:16S rRNA (guanine1207-N2)-methyltransferase
MPNEHKIALDTLVSVLPETGVEIDQAKRIAFLRGHYDERLVPLQPKLVFEQPFKPRAAPLEAAGFRNEERIKGQFDVVLLLSERQRDQTLADFAHALDLLKEGGTVVVCLHNNWGAKRFEKLMAEAAGGISTISKHHCRVFWATKTAALNEELLAEWRAFHGLRRVIDGRFWSQPGMFSWDEIDAGSALLVEHLPANLSGRGADLGAGWGYLSYEVMSRCPDVVSIDLYEADREALEAARRNLGQLRTKSPCRPHGFWCDVPSELMEGRHDFVVMNPPFHDGRAADHKLGSKFIATAARALRAEGELWMVANRHLPYEQVLEETFNEKRLITQDERFKVLWAKGPKEVSAPVRTRERKGKWPGKRRR